MQIILLEKMRRLGELGDTIKVKDGYGRNFLIPQGKAVPATVANRKVFEARRAELEKNAAVAVASAQARADKLAALGAVAIAAKAGEEGKLFGSVGNRDIAEALTKAGVEVGKTEVRMPNGALRMMGEYEIEVALHHDVVGTAKIVIVAL